MSRQPIWGAGLFVLSDADNKNICVGDTVRVTRMAASWDDVILEERAWTGTVVMLKSRGLCVRTISNSYIKPTTMRHAKLEWKWELLEKMKLNE